MNVRHEQVVPHPRRPFGFVNALFAACLLIDEVSVDLLNRFFRTGQPELRIVDECVNGIVKHRDDVRNDFARAVADRIFDVRRDPVRAGRADELIDFVDGLKNAVRIGRTGQPAFGLQQFGNAVQRRVDRFGRGFGNGGVEVGHEGIAR